jgi:MATE family multidrug resistance protein
VQAGSGAPEPFSLLPRRAELRTMLRLAVPVVVVQVGIMAMGTVDTIMVGHLSASALAAVALGNLYFFALAVFGMGVLMSLDPVVAQAVGAGDDEAVARAVQRGLVIAAALSVLVSLLLLPAAPILVALRQPGDVVPQAAAFAEATIPGTLPFFVFVVLRQSLQAMGRMRPIVLAIVAANVVNAALNWVLIYGNLGSPALGAVGSAWASTISRWLMAGALLALAWPELRPTLMPARHDALLARPLARMLRLGAPIGVQHTLEVGAFGTTALLMGLIGTVEMAGHEVAINLASMTFMVPLGVGSAGAVLVGQAIGRGDAPAVQRAAGAAYACGIGFMCASALLFLVAPEWLARLYTNDQQVLGIAASLIPIAGIFQVFDGTQVVSSGILRGAGDTRAPMIVNVLGFWMIGLPVSVYLGFYAGAGPEGLWWGFVAGLAVVGAILLVRVRVRLAQALRRVVIDDDYPAPVGAVYETVDVG